MIEGWNWNLSEAPANTRVIVEARGYDYWGTFDPSWGGGRGAWFDDNGRMISDVGRWHINSERYVAHDRPKGRGVVPIK